MPPRGIPLAAGRLCRASEKGRSDGGYGRAAKKRKTENRPKPEVEF